MCSFVCFMKELNTSLCSLAMVKFIGTLYVAPGTLTQGFSSPQSSKKTDTVIAKSSGWLISAFL